MIRKTNNNKFCPGYREIGTFMYYECNRIQPLWKNSVVVSQTVKHRSIQHPTISIQEKQKHIHTKACTKVFIAILFRMAHLQITQPDNPTQPNQAQVCTDTQCAMFVSVQAQPVFTPQSWVYCSQLGSLCGYVRGFLLCSCCFGFGF